jgi:formamidopyrimidine-DNA glycosylase
MPELPEVETVRRGLDIAAHGARITRLEQRRADLRYPLPEGFAARLTGERINGWRRRGKYLLAELGGGDHLLVHLGMSGRFVILAPDQPRPVPGRHDHVLFHMDNGHVLVFHDPRRFGAMDLIGEGGLARHGLLANMGIEPLEGELDGAFLMDVCQGRKAAVKSLLLDQRHVAGLGNIYVCEALHRAGIAPQRVAGTLDRNEAERLAAAIIAVLQAAIQAGGSTLRDYARPDGELGYFQFSFAVYGRTNQPCRKSGCSGRISRITQSGRSSFYCPDCQKPEGLPRK